MYNMKKSKGKRGTHHVPSNPQLFEDTSSSYGQPNMQGYGGDQGFGGQSYGADQQQYANAGMYANFPGQQFFQNPAMADMALKYGQGVVGQGTDMVSQNVQKVVASSKVKYYFAVDNTYVGKKLLLLLFPYTQSEWSVRYDTQNNEPVAPRDDHNAPDLYIPLMALVTFVLLAGVSLGVQGNFTPEQLGTQTSTALGWLILEILALSFTLYVMNLQTSLRYLDLVAYAGYKHVGMIASVAASIFFQRTGYYVSLVWFSASLAFFLMRTLKLQILPHEGGAVMQSDHGSKRRLYLLLVIAGIQPFLMWLHTRGVVA